MRQGSREATHLPPLTSTSTHDHLTMVYLSPHALFQPQTPRPSVLQKMINSIMLPSQLSISRVEDLPKHHLHRLIAIHLSNGCQLILKIGPPSNTLLLRHERCSLQGEAATLLTLAKSNLPIPQLLKYEPNGAQLGSPFLLTSYLPGFKYSEALPYLSRSEKTIIEAQLRSLRLIINQHSSPTFGPASHVGLGRIGGAYDSWRKAFEAMLESVMQDGEDMMVNIAYFEIRGALSRWGSYLNQVAEAKLVVLGLGKPDNVLIERRTNEVVGLLDLGMAVWGDPAMATIEGKTDIRRLL